MSGKLAEQPLQRWARLLAGEIERGWIPERALMQRKDCSFRSSAAILSYLRTLLFPNQDQPFYYYKQLESGKIFPEARSSTWSKAL